jgi:hypothetical protein
MGNSILKSDESNYIRGSVEVHIRKYNADNYHLSPQEKRQETRKHQSKVLKAFEDMIIELEIANGKNDFLNEVLKSATKNIDSLNHVFHFLNYVTNKKFSIIYEHFNKHCIDKYSEWLKDYKKKGKVFCIRRCFSYSCRNIYLHTSIRQRIST